MGRIRSFWQSLRAGWLALPLSGRKVIVDLVTTAAATATAVGATIPTDLDDAKRQAVVITTAALAAAFAVLRRYAPAFLRWLATQFPA